MSRFSVNQKLPVILLERAPKHAEDVTCNLLFMPYSPLDEAEAPSIKVTSLTVLSEHKVPWEFGDGDETPHVGYILEDDSGSTWHNQYPAASYGQLSDTADGLFDLALNSMDEVQQFLQDNPYGVGQGVLATRYLDDLDRTLAAVTKHAETSPEAAKVKVTLQAHYDHVIQALQDADLSVTRVPREMGGKVIEGMFRHRLAA